MLCVDCAPSEKTSGKTTLWANIVIFVLGRVNFILTSWLSRRKPYSKLREVKFGLDFGARQQTFHRWQDIKYR